LTVSHGNMARSVAAMAAATDVDCAILVPADIPEDRLWPIARYGPALFRVSGAYAGLYQDTLDLPGPIALNSDVPLRVAGQKTLAYEIAAQAPDADAVVLPVSSGGNASAVWKGYRELLAGDSAKEIPRLYLVQSAACDPIARADRQELSAIPTVEAGETIAYSIANPDPPSGWRALRAARASGGGVISVEDPAIDRARERLARRAGVSAEAGAATALAGMRALAADERIRPRESVVCVITGTGLLESPAEPTEVPVVRREAVARALRERFDG
jgi:threonine synthase